MTGDQKVQLEQVEYHASLLRTDLESAKAKKPSQHIERALARLDDVVWWAKVGILE